MRATALAIHVRFSSEQIHIATQLPGRVVEGVADEGWPGLLGVVGTGAVFSGGARGPLPRERAGAQDEGAAGGRTGIALAPLAQRSEER